METKVATIRAYGKNVRGNERFGTYIMIAFQVEKGEDIHDLFLTKEQAKSFQEELNRCMENNND